MEQVESRFKSTENQQKLFIIVLSISFSFTILFFSPAELMIRNQEEFLISAEYILVPMLILSVLISSVSIVLLHILRMIHEGIYIFLSRSMAGMLFAFYIQEMFFNGGMNTLTGDAVELDLSVQKHILNLLMAYLLFILPLVMHLMKKQYPDQKFLQIGKGYLLPYLTGLIFVMQIFGLLGTIAQFGLSRETVFDCYLSYAPSMSLSRNQNIVVFMEDRLDSLYVDEALEAYPELYQELDGFIFYQNNVSRYPQTFPSVVHMLTAEPYDENDQQREYLQKAWSEHNFLHDLKQNQYQINLFPDQLTTVNDYTQLESCCDNLVPFEEDNTHFNYLDRNGIVPTMTRLSFGKLVPYAFKGFFTNGVKSDFSVCFIELENDIPDLASGAIGEASDLKYYAYLTGTGLTDDNPQNTFTFIHFNGTHDASEEVSRLYSEEYLPGKFGILSTARGEFEIILEYIRQMKALNIYDQSTIIILGDHGRMPEPLMDDSGMLTEAITTALLIKPAQAESAPLKTDSSAELYQDYFAASILEYAGIDHEAYGCSYSDMIENPVHTERILQTTVVKSAMYKITGDAREFSNWEVLN